MARVLNSVMLGYSGRIGNHVFRIIKGKTFVSLRPRHHKAGKSAAAKKARNNFSSTILFSKSVNAIPELQKIWLYDKEEGYSPYHKLISKNSALVNEGELTENNIITPAGIDLVLSSLAVENNKLNAGFIFQKNNNVKFPLNIYCIFYFKEFRKTILFVNGQIDEPEADNVYNAEIPLNVLVTRALGEDPHPIIYMAVAGMEPPVKKIYWSVTASKQI